MSKSPFTAQPLPLSTTAERIASDSVRRLVTVQPGMCGPTSLLVGQIGDWTWETVSALCDTDVANARDARGQPTYLSFYYCRLKAGPALHPAQITFGDRLEVISRAFDCGRESVLTLHRLCRADSTCAAEVLLTPEEFYEHPRPGCLYAENFNHWISRSRPGSNRALMRSSPLGFAHRHLPQLPDSYSPRLTCAQARARLRFPPPGTATDYVPDGDVFTVDYPVDVTRDVNGVGLLYFASYFAIAEGALLRRWRHLGRDDSAFLSRTTLDSRVCYLGNADLGATLRLRLRAWHDPDEPTGELVDIVIEDSHDNRLLALCSFQTEQGNRSSPSSAYPARGRP
ncbi:LnmK family bifunctional acyltransferase/decarboxylase [Streptomyces pathocidini]|uniref:LnmK family bifunctional acyltransferase/decarboxylase n=1 Tax=Streptomyces pathocidini TaxID=1650571 RepID=UPI0033F4D83B